MKSGYKCSAKRIAAIGVMLCMLVLTCLTVTSVLNTKAEESIGQGHVNYDVTGLRIRKGPTTNSSIITTVSGGFKFDIYEETTDEDGDTWYGIGFYLNGSYERGCIYGGYITVDKRNDYEPDADFEEYLDSQGFPDSYKDGLRQLHAQYPNWVFVADHNGTDWNTMVEKQNVKTRSLVHKDNISSWKSTADGCYNWETGEWYSFDSGGYVQASSELVQYVLDPRNFLDDTYIFMFEALSYDSSVQNMSGVESIISGSFMDGSSHDLDGYTYPSLLMKAGEMSQVSPYHLATRIIQEQGYNGTGRQISGNVSGYVGYYNYYSQNAYASGGYTAVQNGLRYAKESDSGTLRPWNTRYKAVVGGAINLGKWYINKGQDTIYYEKFDVVNYSHQYMTNVFAPRSEAKTSKRAYSETTLNNTSFKFIIPVYDNMPDEVCAIPTGDGSPNNRLKDLYVDGYSLTPSFSLYTTSYDLIVDNDVTSVYVSGDKLADSAEVEGFGEYSLSVGNNRIVVTVTAENGENQDYVINIVRKEADPIPDPDPVPDPDPSEENGFDTSYDIDEEGRFISGFEVESTADDVISSISFKNGCYGKIYGSDSAEKTSEIIATGDRFVVYTSDGDEYASYAVVIYGDANGDGKITSIDMLYIKRHVLDIRILTSAYYKAADANHDGTVSSIDMLYVKRHVLDIRYIVQ